MYFKYVCLEYLDILVYFIDIYMCVPVCVIYILYKYMYVYASMSLDLIMSCFQNLP